MEHNNVVIMTPGHSMENSYVISLLNTIKELESRGISWGYASHASSDVSVAREATILGRSFALPSYQKYESPLKGLSTYDKLFLIDSDISWKIDDFMHLYESSYDVVSGVYLQADGETTTALVEVNDLNGPFDSGMRCLSKSEIYSKSSPFKVSGTGLGFMCVKQGVFEKVERPWFQHIVQEHQISESEVNVEMLSEDLSFIRRVRETGVDVYVDPTVLVNHSKKTNLHWH